MSDALRRRDSLSELRIPPYVEPVTTVIKPDLTVPQRGNPLDAFRRFRDARHDCEVNYAKGVHAGDAYGAPVEITEEEAFENLRKAQRELLLRPSRETVHAVEEAQRVYAVAVASSRSAD